MGIPMRNAPSETTSFLPENFLTGHNFAFHLHDVMTEILVSGEKAGIFKHRFNFKDDTEAESFKASANIFEWLLSAGRLGDRAKVIKATVLHALLSDMLHCIYEALQCSRKAKLNVTYMLLRKPIQENLFLLECMALDELQFAEKLADTPLKLRAQNAGGVDAHAKRIQKVLDKIDVLKRYDANYIAQLRYAKVEDGFDGICNRAIHLFTEHEAIKTANLNINFIFSDWDSKLTQWGFLYSRLPYLLAYAYELVEHILADLTETPVEYVLDMYLRIAAYSIPWWNQLDETYISDPIERFVNQSGGWLNAYCLDQGYRSPTLEDIDRLVRTGALPGETERSVKARAKKLAKLVASRKKADSAANKRPQA